MGEPGGVGGEITLKAWLNHRHSIPPFFVLDDPERLAALAELLETPAPVEKISNPAETAAVFTRALPVLPLNLPVATEPGTLHPANGPAVLNSIERAVDSVQHGLASAMVTNPIHKLNLSRSGFSYPGHTEYLAALAGIESQPIMMLANSELRVIPVTRHMGIIDAVNTLSSELIVETALITALALKDYFDIPDPRLVIAGLNPHAGEGGVMGKEEIEIIEPAIAEIKKRGYRVSGPHPADTMFHHRAREKYDAALCMYHDQALIPIKTIDFDGAVNVTLGLPFVRTSPDHGTALDIAGTGQAREDSLVAALKLAAKMASDFTGFDATDMRQNARA